MSRVSEGGWWAREVLGNLGCGHGRGLVGKGEGDTLPASVELGGGF